ncbi:MAG: hypothetical protein IJ934_06425 [Acetobacter sp.]|nr:hypothetical protein [Acetobacter sp.]
MDRLYNDDITKTKVPIPPLEIQLKSWKSSTNSIR